MRSRGSCAAEIAASLAAWALAFAAPAQAQDAAVIRARAASAPDLEFGEPKTLRFYSSLPNSVFKPEGAGPFPAIIHFHTCGGVNTAQARFWAEAALERGFVVLVLDVLGPRGVSTVCDTRPVDNKGGVNIFRGVKDAFDAKAHLEKLAIVDAKRISVVGFSWGAMAGLLAASRRFSEAFSDKPFASVASFYPGCHHFYFREDVARPTLVLMGEADDEVYVPGCVQSLDRLKSAGAPVRWRIYPGATHSWDWNVEVNKLAYGGKPVRYVPNPAVKRESAQDLFEFLARN